MTMFQHMRCSYIMFVFRRLVGQQNNHRYQIYFKISKVTFLTINDSYFVKEKSIYNIFKI